MSNSVVSTPTSAVSSAVSISASNSALRSFAKKKIGKAGRERGAGFCEPLFQAEKKLTFSVSAAASSGAAMVEGSSSGFFLRFRNQTCTGLFSHFSTAIMLAYLHYFGRV